MTPLVEAVVLPLVFLSVWLVGAIRPGADAPLVPPTPASLVAAMVLLAIFVRSGTLAPDRLMHGGRTAMANVNGLVVILSVLAAAAQVVTLVVPDAGVPALVGWTVLLALLVQTLVMGIDRPRVLRGLLVTFGLAFLLKFVILASLSHPAGGRLGRAMQLLFEGVTLGTLTQRTLHPSEPYLAFATLVAFLLGVAWLPSARWEMIRRESPRRLPRPPSHAEGWLE